MVQPQIPPFLLWEIPEEGAETQLGFTPLKSSEPVRALDPGCGTAHLCLLSQLPGTLSSKPSAHPQLHVDQVCLADAYP